MIQPGLLKSLLLILAVCGLGSVSAQTFCPSNINFEAGTLGSWKFYTATNNGTLGLSTLTSTTPLTNRHVLTSGTGTDYYGGFPVVDPIGGSYSLKLGNDSVGAQVDQARYTFTIPASVNNYSIIYRYAVVFEDPTHIAAEQPFFRVRVYDSTTGVAINCASFNYLAQNGLPGFSTSSRSGRYGSATVYYKPWATASLNLSGQAGKTLVLEFTTADCSRIRHMGYGYVDVSCGTFGITASACSATAPLSAPPGFASYKWYNTTYTRAFDSGQSIVISTPTTLTQYHVVLTPYPGYGCADTLHTQLIRSSLALAAIPDTMLCNNPGVVLNPVVTGNAPPYSYAWSPAAGLSCTTCAAPTAIPVVNTAYMLAVTDSFGCVKRDTVNVRAAVLATASATAATCFGTSTGTATATASLGTGPYSYSWNTVPGQVSATATALTAGTYIVTVTDTRGCTDTQSITVRQPTQIIATITATDSVKCNGGADGQATVSATGGTSPYAYSWNTTPVKTSITATGLPAGISIATVTDALGCTDTAVAVIGQPAVLTSAVSHTPVLCHGGATGTAVSIAAGGKAPYSYAADGGSYGPSATLAGLSAGSHTIHLKDANGCIKDTTIIIAEPPVLLAGFTAVQPLCYGASNGSVTISATGGTPAYQYALGAGSFSSTGSFGSLGAGAYVLHIRDANGCTADSNIMLAQPARLTAALIINPVSCHGGSDGTVGIVASGGTPAYTYAVDAAPFSNAATLTSLTAGSHIVRLKDANGCATDSTVTVTQPLPLSMGFVSRQPLCNGATNGTITISGTGGTTPYQYAVNGSSYGTSGAFTALAAGTYTLRIKDAHGCTRDSIITLAQPSVLNTATTQKAVTCNGGADGAATVTVSGGTGPYTYTWTGTTQTTASVTGLTAANYTVTIKDANGCTTAATAGISQPAALAATFSTTAPVCNNTSTGSVTVAVSGGTSPYTYSWSTTPARTTAGLSGIAAGVYTVTVTDGAGCKLVSSATVAQTPPVVVSVFPSSASCFGLADAGAYAIATGSTGPYTYAWNTMPVQSGDTAKRLRAGSYAVTATSQTGCAGSVTFSVTEPPLLVLSLTTRNTCSGLSQGSISAVATGGTRPYTYQWSTAPVLTTATVSGLAAGSYAVYVRDSKGCPDTADATVATFPDAIVDAGPAQIVCLGSGATLTAAGARSYVWTPVTTLSCAACPSPVASPAVRTTYTVVGTDSNGCTATDTVSVEVIPHVPVSVGEKQRICAGDSARLSVRGGIDWQWFPADEVDSSRIQAPVVYPKATTSYLVSVTENECFKDTLQQVVEVLPIPVVSLGPDIDALIGASIQLKAEVTGADRISWTPVTGLSCATCFDPTHIVRGKATYIAKVQNELGCPAYDTINIRDICDEKYFYFANTFTPNGDGQNDRFYPQGIGTFPVAHFMIYDRWGEIVFAATNISANDPSSGWDGTYKNQALKPDVYVYVMDAVCETGARVVVRGDISLIR